MARADGRTTRAAARTRATAISDEAARPTMTEEAGRPRVTEMIETPVLTAAVVNDAFKGEKSVREALTKNLKERTAESKAIAARADAAFAQFHPTRYSAAQRRHSNYLPPSGDVGETMRSIIETTVESMAKEDLKRSIRLRPIAELDDLIKKSPKGSDTAGTIRLGKLLDYLNGRSTGSGTTLTAEPPISQCETDAAAEDVLKRIEGVAPDGPPPPSTNGSNGSPASSTTKEFVQHQVHELMEQTTPPESQVAFSVERRLTDAETQGRVQSFELREGASDVTSFHDFYSLQIAFPHVWTEVFDAELTRLGRDLYEKYVHLQVLTDSEEDEDKKRKFSTLEDLRALVADVRGLILQTQDNTPSTPGFNFSGFLGAIFGHSVPSTPAATPTTEPEQEGGRLFDLLEAVDGMLAQKKHAFDVYAKDSINFGVFATYRQKWQPERYQVGDLVSTIPLAPKEMQRYTTKVVSKKTRAMKELEDNMQTRRDDSSYTSRADKEIVDRAQNKTSFNLTAQESFGSKDSYQIEATQNNAGEEAKQSESIKKDFRESVIKSAQEYKQQHRVEIDTSESMESEETTFHEIQNPNDELTVTYLFYELQRTYRISERLHKVTPVILVANDVPRPNEINDAWLMEYDWILRRVILDDSFRPALDYLTTSFVGAELNIRIMKENAIAQKQLVDSIRQQVALQIQVVTREEEGLTKAVQKEGTSIEQQGIFDTIKRVFDPLGITGNLDSAEAKVDAAQTAVEYAKSTLERAERERSRLLGQLDVAVTALQTAVDKLSRAVQQHYDRVNEIDRLRIHVKDNILYYMQAIWSHEPPDQRFFRIYNIDVPIVTAKAINTQVNVYAGATRFGDALRGEDGAMSIQLPIRDVTVTTKKLVEVADLDTVLGYKGNYMIFALKENNYITWHMMQDYIEVGTQLTLRDPDELGELDLEDIERMAACLRRSKPETYEKNRTKIKKLIVERLTSPWLNNDLVIVPTNSLYIEALVGTHPLLEDFKLIHRALDVKKVQADVRHVELENVRLAARALKGKDDDPDVEKKIVIENGKSVVIDTE